jgi:hypothetical protein
MKSVLIAFKIHDADTDASVGYKSIPCHVVFGIKIDFTRKARLVAGGHVTDPSVSITYSSVASRNYVRIACLIAALNERVYTFKGNSLKRMRINWRLLLELFMA